MSFPQPFSTPERNRQNNIIFKDKHVGDGNQEVWLDLIPGNCLFIAAKLDDRTTYGSLLFQVEGYFNDVLIFAETIFELDSRVPLFQEHWVDSVDAVRCNCVKIIITIAQSFVETSTTYSLYTAEY